MFQKIGVLCIAFLSLTSVAHSQISHQLPRTIYAVDQEAILADVAVFKPLQLDDFTFRIIDRDQVLKGNFVINLANIGVPATTFDAASYKDLALDKYFFKGYDLYEMHSSQHANWKNQQRIERNTAKALEKSYSQFGQLN